MGSPQIFLGPTPDRARQGQPAVGMDEEAGVAAAAGPLDADTILRLVADAETDLFEQVRRGGGGSGGLDARGMLLVTC